MSYTGESGYEGGPSSEPAYLIPVGNRALYCFRQQYYLCLAFLLALRQRKSPLLLYWSSVGGPDLDDVFHHWLTRPVLTLRGRGRLVSL